MAAIFISHSSRDDEAATALAARLREAGFSSLFLDRDPGDGIDAGASWERTLYARLRQCHAVVVVLTPAWLESKWCFAEAVQAREKGKAIVPVLAESCALPAILAEFQSVDWRERGDDALSQLVAGLEALGLGAGRAAAVDPDQPPYPGLAAFDEAQAGLFFGRDEETQALRETLESLRRHGPGAPRLVLVLGASGSGKSSLVRAGLLPALRTEPSSWIVVRAFRPLGDPFGELAAALERAWQRTGASAGGSPSLDGLLSGDAAARGEALVRAAKALRRGAGADGASVLLALDQMEELLVPGAAHCGGDFLTALRIAMETEGARLLVVATLRSDVLGAFQTHAAVTATAAAAALAYRPFTVEPMPTRRFAEVIRGPARIAGLELEDGLVEQLVADAEVPDALPILAFTLRQLHDRFGREAHRITRADYESLGRLEGAVRSEADRIIETLDPSPAELEALRAAFVPRLAQVSADGAYTRRRARRSQMPHEAARLLDAFVDARLLVSDRDRDGDETVEIAHEALLRVWPRLAAWLDEDRARLQLLASVQHAAVHWRRAGQSEDLLVHRRSRLTDAVELDRDPRFRLADDSDARAYLDACVVHEVAREQRARRARRLAFAAISAAAFGFAVLAGIAYKLQAHAEREQAIAEQQRDAALRATSARDVVQADSARTRGDIVDAVIFARRAIAGDGESGTPPYSYAAARALFDALEPYRHLERVIPRSADRRLALLDGAAKLLGASDTGWWLADVATGRIDVERNASTGYGFALSSDASTALAIGPPIAAWRVATGEPIDIDPQGRVADAGAMSADLSRDGRFAIVGTANGRVYSLDLAEPGRASGPVLRFPEATTDYVHHVRIAPDATRVVAIQADRIWIHAYGEGRLGERVAAIGIRGGERFSSREPEAPRPAFLGDSSLLALPLADELRVLDVARGRFVPRNAGASREARSSPRVPATWALETGTLLVDGIVPLRRIDERRATAAALHAAASDLAAVAAPGALRLPRELAGARVPDLHARLGLPDNRPIEWPTHWPLGIVAGWRSDNMIAFGAGYRALLRHDGVETAVLGEDARLAATAGRERTLLWRFDGAGRTLFAPGNDLACAARVLDAVCRPDGAVILASEQLSRRPLESCVLHTPGGGVVHLPRVTYVTERPGLLAENGTRAVLRTDSSGAIGVFDTASGDEVADTALAERARRRLAHLAPSEPAPVSTDRVSIAGGVLTFAAADGKGPVRWTPADLAPGIAIDATGTRALTRSETAIEVWNIADGRLVERIGVPGTHCAAFSPQGAIRAVVPGGAWVEWMRPGADAEARLLDLARMVSGL